MGVSVEIKVFFLLLGNNQIWKKLQPGTEANYNFIKYLEDHVLGLAGKVQYNKTGGTTGHIGMIMPAPEFVLIQGTTTFALEVHSGVINYLLPTACTTVHQHMERKYEHTDQLQAFKMECTLDGKLKGHVFLCFDKDDYIALKQDQIRYTNISTQQVFEYLYQEYGEKNEELQNKALDNMDKDLDISEP